MVELADGKKVFRIIKQDVANCCRCTLVTAVSAIRTNTRCKEDPIYVFQEMKQRGPVPNVHIHVSFLGIFVSNFRYNVFAVRE